MKKTIVIFLFFSYLSVHLHFVPDKLGHQKQLQKQKVVIL